LLRYAAIVVVAAAVAAFAAAVFNYYSCYCSS